MDPHFVDGVCVVSMLMAPKALVFAFGWRGVILGALFIWGIGELAGQLLDQLDPA